MIDPAPATEQSLLGKMDKLETLLEELLRFSERKEFPRILGVEKLVKRLLLQSPQDFLHLRFTDACSQK
jgi:hypothetical protein